MWDSRHKLRKLPDTCLTEETPPVAQQRAMDEENQGMGMIRENVQPRTQQNPAVDKMKETQPTDQAQARTVYDPQKNENRVPGNVREMSLNNVEDLPPRKMEETSFTDVKVFVRVADESLLKDVDEVSQGDVRSAREVDDISQLVVEVPLKNSVETLLRDVDGTPQRDVDTSLWDAVGSRQKYGNFSKRHVQEMVVKKLAARVGDNSLPDSSLVRESVQFDEVDQARCSGQKERSSMCDRKINQTQPEMDKAECHSILTDSIVPATEAFPSMKKTISSSHKWIPAVREVQEGVLTVKMAAEKYDISPQCVYYRLRTLKMEARVSQSRSALAYNKQKNAIGSDAQVIDMKNRAMGDAAVCSEDVVQYMPKNTSPVHDLSASSDKTEESLAIPRLKSAKYQQKDMLLAIRAVCKGLAYNKAAKKYNVTASTLRFRVLEIMGNNFSPSQIRGEVKRGRPRLIPCQDNIAGGERKKANRKLASPVWNQAFTRKAKKSLIAATYKSTLGTKNYIPVCNADVDGKRGGKTKPASLCDYTPRGVIAVCKSKKQCILSMKLAVKDVMERGISLNMAAIKHGVPLSTLRWRVRRSPAFAPGKTRERKKRKQYSLQDMKLAMEDVMKRGIKLQKAAIKRDVPSSTLYWQIKHSPEYKTGIFRKRKKVEIGFHDDGNKILKKTAHEMSSTVSSHDSAARKCEYSHGSHNHRMIEIQRDAPCLEESLAQNKLLTRVAVKSTHNSPQKKSRISPSQDRVKGKKVGRPRRSEKFISRVVQEVAQGITNTSSASVTPSETHSTLHKSWEVVRASQLEQLNTQHRGVPEVQMENTTESIEEITCIQEGSAMKEVSENLKEHLQPSKCIFCNIGEERELELGKLHTGGTHTVHYYCLLFSSGLPQNGDDEEGIMGFLPADIEKELHRGRKLKCCYCFQKGATVGCAEKMCRRTYHYSCGAQHYAAFRFSNDFRSYCVGHHTYPRELKNRLTDGKECMICMDAMPRDPRRVVYASCCGAFLHKLCVQQLALSAGYFFKCPLCNDKETFTQEMQHSGIYVPEQDASWELEPNAFSDLLERPVHCDALPCKCPDGPKMDEDGTRWEILLCNLCGSSGVHVACGGLPTTCTEWTCPGCAKTLRESVQRMQSEIRQRRLAQRNRKIAESLTGMQVAQSKESSSNADMVGGDVYVMKKEDTERDVNVDDMNAELQVTPDKRKLETAEVTDATPSKLMLVEEEFEEEERDGRSVFGEEMEEGDIDWDKFHAFPSSTIIRALEEAGEEIPLELEELKKRAIYFQERMAALRLTEDDIVKITKESSSTRFKEKPVSRADVMRFYRYNLPLTRMLEVLDILKAVVALRKAKVAEFKGKGVRKSRRAMGTPNIKETLLKTAVSQSLIQSKRSPRVKRDRVGLLDTPLTSQTTSPRELKVNPFPAEQELLEGRTETTDKACMEVMKKKSRSGTSPTSPHTSSTSFSHTSHSSASASKQLSDKGGNVRQKLFPEIYPSHLASNASTIIPLDFTDCKEENKNKFQKSVEMMHEKVEEKNGRNLDETSTCPQTSRPATSSKRYDQRNLPQVFSPLPLPANPGVRGRRNGARGHKRKQETCLEMELDPVFVGEGQRLRGRENLVPHAVKVPHHDSSSTLASDISSNKSSPSSETDASFHSSLSKCNFVTSPKTRSYNVPSVFKSGKSVSTVSPKPTTDRPTQDNEFNVKSDVPMRNAASKLKTNSSILKVKQESSSDNHSIIPTHLVPSRHKASSLTSAQNFTPIERTGNSCVSVTSKPKVQITFGNSPPEQNKKRRYRLHPKDQNKYIQKSLSSFIIAKKGV